jgi:hypothetical protein
MPDRPQWRFRQMQPGEMNIDPIEAEFFSTEALGSLADALVREAIQNSLDARRPGSPLRVRVLFSTAGATLDGERKALYVAGLADHLSASRASLTKLPEADEPLDFVVFEDFGTRGLQGDPAQSEDAEIDATGPRNDFYYFWRNVGRSRKQASELGRWGLGKTVFPAASRINSFFGISVRGDDDRRLLMGQSVLKIHKAGGKRYYPYGYFGRFEGDFAVPLDNAEFLDAFARDFHLARGSESGLSLVVPYPDPELTPDAVVPSIVRHYFVPIIRRDLEVEVVHGGNSILLNASTLPRFLAEVPWDDRARFQRLVDLAKWGLAIAQADHAGVAVPPEPNAPRWADHCIRADDVARLKERLNDGQHIALTVPVWVKPAAGDPVLSHFEVYLERDEALEGADEHFVRDGITIAGVRGALQKGFRAFVTVHDQPLSQLLGDSENPAHTEWQERSPKFRDRYRHGAFTLRYVKNAPREIVRVLTRPSEGRDLKLLQHLFSLEVPTEEAVIDPRKGRQDSPGMEPSGGPDGVEMVGKDTFFVLQKLRGGFRIAGAGDSDTTPPFVTVRVAYEVRRGNPFSQYQPPDFQLDMPPIDVSAERAEIVRRAGNQLMLRAQAPDFQVTVKGFDVNRDIRVKVLGIDEEEEE